MDFPLSSAAAAGFRFVPETGSTNQDLLDTSGSLPEFYVLSTDFQSAGRGRLDRKWEATPGSSVMASMLLRPKFEDSSGYGWLPLITALAITRALQQFEITALVKWPNDVLIGQKKVSGVLTQAAADLAVVVVGFGINVYQQADGLPTETSTSLAIESTASISRDQLLSSVIANLRGLYGELAMHGGDPEASGSRDLVIAASATLGQQVAVEYPDGKTIKGKAIDIDRTGRLCVEAEGETLRVLAGDVTHLRTI